MGLPIFYAVPESINSSGRLTLTGDESRHLARSLRAVKGDIVSVGDGRGARYRAKICDVTPVLIEMEIQSVEVLEKEMPRVAMIQAVSRPSHMDSTISRAAEAGAEVVVPFQAPRSRKVDGDRMLARLDRWRSIARESSKVARRVWPLEVGRPSPWPPESGLLDCRELNLVLWEDEADRCLSDALPEETPSSVGIVVGPEGGFCADDVDTLRNLGATTVSLGELNIRAEAAGSYAVMIVRYHYGLLSPRGG